MEPELQDPEGFGSYKEVQQWLQTVCGVNVAYKTVHGTVHYRLKAKLKRPRPRSEKQAPGAVEAFKRTLDASSLER
ncbi:winged helix-turn-helix domain-containing protein [Phormidium sp. FACHB-322]|nr:winged helix-turn-helix domain-containing protein [Phormidium sp. FACHB-77]MBD2029694.1 winged helix-turn-helix domain-containing protein [Phormidium sp. FACHB-322]MBD2049595.1 winged helix-turn-helix domain-containing protein [Leptolyngbya sp. FACHB-60]